MLTVIAPDVTEMEVHRIRDDALFDLRELFATLPDGRYKIFRVQPGNNSRRLIIEVYVRSGRIIDPSDSSEGTSDPRPLTKRQSRPCPSTRIPFWSHP